MVDWTAWQRELVAALWIVALFDVFVIAALWLGCAIVWDVRDALARRRARKRGDLWRGM